MSPKIPLKPENETFTDSQWQAIFDGENNLLVSASAGSGKTTVLVRRVIEKLKQGADLERLLIVTYTEAAAREMKERLQSALQKALNEETDPMRKQHFLKQLIVLPTAHISTLHAFCLTVIRRFYYLIDLDPVFRLLTDETETLLLKEDVWEQLRERYYEEKQAAFYQLTANFSNDRTDEGLTHLVFALYEFACANPEPEKWLAELSQTYQTTTDLGESPLYQQFLKPPTIDKLTRCQQRYAEMLTLVEGEEKLVKITDLVYAEKHALEQVIRALEQNQLTQAYQLSQSLTFARYPSIRSEDYKEVAQAAKSLREQNKKTQQEVIQQLFVLPPTEMQAVMQKAGQVVAELAQVGQAFLTAYRQKKRQQDLLDFNDLEHLTIQILTNQTTDEWQPSEASTYYRQRFDEIMVDEYQDVNRLQETLLSWLRKPADQTGNLFMVGDVKQSIYSFRLADPTLFIEKYQAYQSTDAGQCIILAENFRSRRNVLDFTNLVFSQLMDEQVGQIAYDEAAELKLGFTGFPETANYDTELLIYEKQASDEEAPDLPKQAEVVLEDKTEGELAITALKIRELIDRKFLIYDKKMQQDRPLTYSDIVLLTPTKKNNLTILETFKQFGIPLEVNDAQNYFQATEVQIMVALLQIIDNPEQDIPLAAVLRSPIVGLKEPELARIRLAEPTGSYHEALKTFNQQPLTNEPEWTRTQAATQQFMAYFQKWREMARRQPLAELLWRIYEDTAFLDYVGGMLAGQQRQANLYALVERAAAFEKTTFRGLFQFVRFIEKMQEKDKDLAEPVVFSDSDAVRVMTIHASKGLEFPVVFVLDMTKEFNVSDLNERYIFDDQLGIGIRYLEEPARILYDTLPYLALKQAKLAKLLAEEMRKLYVALTRAEQKLFLVGSYNDRQTALKTWGKIADVSTRTLPSENRLQAKSSLMNWVGMSLVRHPAMAEYFTEFDVVAVPEVKQHPAGFSISFTNEGQVQEAFYELQQTAETAKTKQILPVAAAQFVAQAKRRLNYQYPYQVATATTNYQSVSEIKRLFEDPDNQEIAPLDWERKTTTQPTAMVVHRLASGELGRPRFMETKQNVSYAEIGTATHYVLQRLPLEQPITLANVQAFLDQLVKEKTVASDVAKRINCQQIAAFFQTNAGQFLQNKATQVKKEQPFSMLLPANELIKDYPNTHSDDLLVHGIIDGFVESETDAVLYDFKTDYVKNPQDPAAIRQVIQRYQGQLKLYQRALSNALNKPVTKVWLILLTAGLIIDMQTKTVIEKFPPK